MQKYKRLIICIAIIVCLLVGIGIPFNNQVEMQAEEYGLVYEGGLLVNPLEIKELKNEAENKEQFYIDEITKLNQIVMENGYTLTISPEELSSMTIYHQYEYLIIFVNYSLLNDINIQVTNLDSSYSKEYKFNEEEQTKYNTYKKEYDSLKATFNTMIDSVNDFSSEISSKISSGAVYEKTIVVSLQGIALTNEVLKNLTSENLIAFAGAYELSEEVKILDAFNTSTLNTYEEKNSLKASLESNANNLNTLITSNSDRLKKEDEAKKKAEVQKQQPQNAEYVPVLMYHFFEDGPGDGWNTMSIDMFESHLQMFKEEGITPITTEQFACWFEGKCTLPPKPVLITIDDGKNSTWELAEPLLAKYGYTAVSFEITSFYDNYEQKQKSTSIEMHSHTHNMHWQNDSGRGVMETKSVEDGVADLEKNKSIIGQPNDEFFAYPYGHYGGNAKATLKEAGYKYAFTTQGGFVYKGMDPLELPRVRVEADETAEELKEEIGY